MNKKFFLTLHTTDYGIIYDLGKVKYISYQKFADQPLRKKYFRIFGFSFPIWILYQPGNYVRYSSFSWEFSSLEAMLMPR